MNGIEGVVLTGVYGAGKTSVIEEMAHLLEQRDVGYAAIDVDWLWWFDIKGLSDQQYQQILFANLKAVVSNYLDAGVDRFLLAWSIRSQEELDELTREWGPRVHGPRGPVHAVHGSTGSHPRGQALHLSFLFVAFYSSADRCVTYPESPADFFECKVLA